MLRRARAHARAFTCFPSVQVLSEILDALPLGSPYTIKLNHRKLLDAIMAVAGVPADKFRTVCSAIDKLDKEPWIPTADDLKLGHTGVRKEIVDKLGGKPAHEKVADVIEHFVKEKGSPIVLLAKLKKDALLLKSESAQKAFVELNAMCEFMRTFGMLDRVTLDLSLARGLDYYTGVIYEAVLQKGGSGDSLGSIAAGGRYDGLVGMFSGKAVPAVGVSVGIERIFNLLEDAERKKGAVRRNHTQVLICTIGKDLLQYRLELASELWKAGIAAEFEYHSEPKPKEQGAHAAADLIPVTLWVGKEEKAAGTVKMKDMRGDYAYVTDAKNKAKNHGVDVPREELVSYLRKLLNSA